MTDSDSLGDRMKGYEAIETDRYFIPRLPVYARIDGRSFSSFTRGFNRPYDERMSNAMIETAKYLTKETNSVISYVQSDEISLAWFPEDVDSQIFFDGKIFKMTSTLSALATVAFFKECLKDEFLAERANKMMPTFDARVFVLPNKDEVANAFLWRERDATKNAISMAARAYYSHKELDNKSGSEKQEMLFQKGVNFNDYPDFFKRGTFVRRRNIERFLSSEELEKIPVKHRPTGPVIRSEIVTLKVPSFNKVTNRVEFIFSDVEPTVDAGSK